MRNVFSVSYDQGQNQGDQELLAYGAVKVATVGELLTDNYDWRQKLFYCPRKLAGDFNALAQKLSDFLALQVHEQKRVGLAESSTERIFNFSDILCQMSPLAEGERLAAAEIMKDLIQTADFKTHVCIEGVRTDNSFSMNHHDQGFRQGRILCTYNSVRTTGLYNEDLERLGIMALYNLKSGVSRKVEIPNGYITRHSVERDDFSCAEHADDFFVHFRPDTFSESYPRLILKGMS